MAALAAAVRPFAGGVPRHAAPVPCDASERASGKKPPRRVVAPARDSSSVCLAGGVEELDVHSQKRKMMTCNRNNVETAAADTKVLAVRGEMSSARELLQKRLASELDVLRGLLKKAELVSRRGGACNGGAPPAAGKKVRFLASNSKQQPEPTDEDGGGNAAWAKRRRISALVEEKQRQVRAPPRMSKEERNQFARRLSSLSGEQPGQIVEFLLKQYAGGKIEINLDSVEDSVLFEMKTLLDKFAQERHIVVDVLPEEKDDEKLAEESKSKGVLKQEVKTVGSKPSSRSSSGSDSDTRSYSACKSGSGEFPALREALPEQIIATSKQPPSEPPPASGTTAQKVVQVQDVQRAAPKSTVPLAGLIYRAKARRELMEMERAAQSGEAKKVVQVQDVQRAVPKSTIPLAGLICRAKVRRELMEMERAVLPDDRIDPRDLQRLGIAEYGHPGIMRQLGLFLKADDA